MDPRDRHRPPLAGAGCAVCGARVGPDRTTVLAERDELAFLELHCPVCGSDSLVLALDGDTVPPGRDELGFGEFGPFDEIRFAGARPIGTDDVLAVSRFLASYRGDALGLLGDAGGRA